MRWMNGRIVAAVKVRWGKTAVSKQRTRGTVSVAPFFAQSSLHADQEVVRQQRQGQMMMPADPAAHFVMVHAQLAFALLDRRLDRPAHPTAPNKRARRSR